MSEGVAAGAASRYAASTLLNSTGYDMTQEKYVGLRFDDAKNERPKRYAFIEGLYDRLVEFAHRTHRTQSAAVRYLVKQALDRIDEEEGRV